MSIGVCVRILPQSNSNFDDFKKDLTFKFFTIEQGSRWASHDQLVVHLFKFSDLKEQLWLTHARGQNSHSVGGIDVHFC